MFGCRHFSMGCPLPFHIKLMTKFRGEFKFTHQAGRGDRTLDRTLTKRTLYHWAIPAYVRFSIYLKSFVLLCGAMHVTPVRRTQMLFKKISNFLDGLILRSAVDSMGCPLALQWWQKLSWAATCSDHQPTAGFEPSTVRLRSARSTTELYRRM